MHGNYRSFMGQKKKITQKMVTLLSKSGNCGKCVISSDMRLYLTNFMRTIIYRGTQRNLRTFPFINGDC